MTSLNRSIEMENTPAALWTVENRPNSRARGGLRAWGAFLVAVYLGSEILVQYPAFLDPLVPAPWWDLLVRKSLALMVLALLIPSLLKREGLTLADIGFEASSWSGDARRGVLAGTMIGLLHFSLLMLATLWTGSSSINSGVVESVKSISFGPVEVAGLIFSTIILGPVIEEVIYRGCLMASTRAGLGAGRWTALLTVLLSGIFFSAAHALGHPLYSAVYLITGLAFAGFYQMTGSLSAAIFAHATVNALGALYVCIQVWRG